MSQNMVNTQCLASSPQEVLIHQEIGILGALKWGDIPKKWAILYGEHFWWTTGVWGNVSKAIVNHPQSFNEWYKPSRYGLFIIALLTL